MDNTIDDAKFDEILKQNNVTPIAAGADPWADFGGPIVPKPSIIDTIKSRTNAVVEHPGEAAKGFVKRAGRTAVDTAELMGKGFKAAGVPEGTFVTPSEADIANANERLTANTEAEKGGGNLEAAAELASLGKDIAVGGAKLIGNVTPKILEGSANIVKGGINAIKNIGVKTDEEILATSADKLAKLTSEQRARWSKLHSDKIAELDNVEKQAAELVKDTAIKEAKTKITALKDEAKQLDYDFTTKTIEEAQSLKPKVLEAMRKNSDEYRKLVDAEINPVRETYVNDDSIMQSIRNRFPSDPYSPDPYKADRIIKEMGLKEGSTRKVGELYDALKGEKAAISTSGKTGNKVFTSSDMDRTDKISALSDALKENGVDLKNANEFWKNYAPMRDKIVKNINPFKPEGAESGSFNTFTNMVKNSLAKPDAKNANFIKATEDMLGVKIGNPETRAAFEKLSAKQKEIIAIAAEKEAKIEAAEAAKLASKNVAGEAKRGVESQMSLANQKAASIKRRNDFIKYIAGIIGVGGITGTVLK